MRLNATIEIISEPSEKRTPKSQPIKFINQIAMSNTIKGLQEIKISNVYLSLSIASDKALEYGSNAVNVDFPGINLCCDSLK